MAAAKLRTARPLIAFTVSKKREELGMHARTRATEGDRTTRARAGGDALLQTERAGGKTQFSDAEPSQVLEYARQIIPGYDLQRRTLDMGFQVSCAAVGQPRHTRPYIHPCGLQASAPRVDSDTQTRWCARVDLAAERGALT
jgi:hypothetical protein